jgi:Fe-Mn family superoxide dismutase
MQRHEDIMAFELPPLPYDYKALEPHISANTMHFHHDKHHQAYVNTVNELIKGTPDEKKSLEEIIKAAAGQQDKVKLFNNAAQVWNHTFFWHCMKAPSGAKPNSDIASALDKEFGSLDGFKDAFKKASIEQFGSGWAWLVLDKGAVKIVKTANADLPLAHGQTALLTCDVWEHAYYLDYQNRRPDFVQAFLDHLVDWDFVAKNLTSKIAAE